MVDDGDLKSFARKSVRVQVPLVPPLLGVRQVGKTLDFWIYRAEVRIKWNVNFAKKYLKT